MTPAPNQTIEMESSSDDDWTSIEQQHTCTTESDTDSDHDEEPTNSVEQWNHSCEASNKPTIARASLKHEELCQIWQPLLKVTLVNVTQDKGI